MRKTLTWLRVRLKKLPRLRLRFPGGIDRGDIYILIGLGMGFAGLYLRDPSLALVVVGGIVLLFGLFDNSVRHRR